MKQLETPSAGAVAYAANMGIACLLSYWIATVAFLRFIDGTSDVLGGMWAAVAAVFVFRDSCDRSLSAGIARLVATCVSFALCLLYLCVLPPGPVGMAALLAIGTIVMVALDRRDDIATTGITTVVVMVVATMSAGNLLLQPLLRLLDTVIGIAVGLGIDWAGPRLHAPTGTSLKR
ncbi:MAG: FUSC family protein [Rhizomicrobium sp.]